MIVEITGTDSKRTSYSVRPIESQMEEHLRAYQMKKLSDDTVYHVTQAASGLRDCDCAARNFEDRSCKHIKALASLGLFLTDGERAAINRGNQRR
jgi:hypothetical protein